MLFARVMGCKRDIEVETDMVRSTYRAPKLGIITSRYDSSLTIWAQSSSNEIECFDQFLAIAGVQSILWRFAHGDDEDVAIVALECKVSFVDY